MLIELGKLGQLARHGSRRTTVQMSSALTAVQAVAVARTSLRTGISLRMTAVARGNADLSINPIIGVTQNQRTYMPVAVGAPAARIRVGLPIRATSVGVATCTPLLYDYDFRNGKPADVTGTRASIATYVDSAGVIQTSSSGVFNATYDPITLDCLGLLVERARTNVCFASDDAQSNGGFVSNGSVSANQIAAPDGATTADKIIEAVTGVTTHTVSRGAVDGSITNSVDFLSTCFVKAGERTKTYFVQQQKSGFTPGEATVNLSTGAFTGVAVYTSTGAQQFANGWWRIWGVVNAATGTPGCYQQLQTINASDERFYAGDGTSGSYWWGGDIQDACVYPTSYIPTSSGTVARNAVTLTKTRGVAAEETVYLAGRTALGTGTGITQVLYSRDNGTANERIRVIRNASREIHVEVTDGGVAQADLNMGVVANDTDFALAIRIKANDIGASINGGAMETDTAATLPSPTTDRFGHDHSGNQWDGAITVAKCWAAAFSDAELRALSALDPTEQAVTYTADNTTKLYNPERGWNMAYVPGGGGEVQRTDQQIPFPAFDSTILTQAKQGTRADPIYNGTFTTTFSELNGNISWVRLDFIYANSAGNYYEQTLPAEVTTRFTDSMNALRAAGMKCILVCGYNWGVQNWDSTEVWMKAHIDQMAPLWETHKDVIALFYAGLYGGTFEGNASAGGTDNITHLQGVYVHPSGNNFPQRLSASGVRIYEYLLDNIPAERMMVVRYPRFKWDLLGITGADVITSATAFDGSDRSRIGFASQGYMGDGNDFAMFQLAAERSYAETDSQWVPYVGEVSVTTNAYNGADDRVLTHSEPLHLTSLNRFQSDALATYTQWITNGDMDTVINKMGYRYRLVTGNYPTQLARGDTITASFSMANDGWGRAFNPRGVELVLKPVAGGSNIVITHDAGFGNRRWLPGPGQTSNLSISGTIPLGSATGAYTLHLNLHDPMSSLRDNPLYSIRLANVGLWDATTGFNSLDATVTIT
jgi:hypothetical protein